MGDFIRANSKKLILELSVRLSFHCLPSFLGIGNCSQHMGRRFVPPLGKYLQLGLIIDILINFAM